MCDPNQPAHTWKDPGPPVKGSDHYQAGGVEVLDVLQAKMTETQYEGFLLGNIIKYALRYNFAEKKMEDLKKCLHYCELLLGWRSRRNEADMYIKKEVVCGDRPQTARPR